MKTLKTNEERLEELNRKLFTDEVEERQGMKYMTGESVIQQLNLIFGNCNWENKVILKTLVQNEMKKTADKEWNGKVTPGYEAHFVGYIVEMSLTVPNLTTGIGTITITDVGAGAGIDKDLLKAHESAIKEAYTDSIKRCAKQLGNSTGLCLYEKGIVLARRPSETSKEKVVGIPANTSGISKAMQERISNFVHDTDRPGNRNNPVIKAEEITGPLIRNKEPNTFETKGDTRSIKDEIKSAGFRYDAAKQCWWISTTKELSSFSDNIRKYIAA